MAATVEATIPDLLLTHLGALVLSPALPIAYPNLPFTPPPGAYLRATHMPNRTERLFIPDGRPNRHQGILQVSVFWPVNAQGYARGIIVPIDVAGQIANHFPEGLKLPIGNSFVRIDKRPSVAPPMQEPDRIQIPVSIEWVAYV